MGLFSQVRDWISGGPPQERLAALVSQPVSEPGLWPEDPLGFVRGKILYATNPQVAEDPIYLTRMVFHLQTLACAREADLTMRQTCVHNLLNTGVSPGFVAPLPVDVMGVDGLFLHDIHWYTTDHPDWIWWQPNHGLRRIQLDAQGNLRRILPAAPGDAGRYARRRIRLLRSTGASEVTACLVQANGDIYSTDDPYDQPAAVIFSDDPLVNLDELLKLADRLYALRDGDETPADLADALAVLRANTHCWHYHRRERAGAGKPHFVADLFLPREFLRGGFLQERTFRCLVEPGESGGIELLPYNTEQGPDVIWDPSWAAWNDGVVVRLAHAIAEESKYADLPILGDALEEAGCGDAQILEHCRAALPHAHNCWVLDGLIALGGPLS